MSHDKYNWITERCRGGIGRVALEGFGERLVEVRVGSCIGRFLCVVCKDCWTIFTELSRDRQCSCEAFPHLLTSNTSIRHHTLKITTIPLVLLYNIQKLSKVAPK
jgi:hypothetical protein